MKRELKGVTKIFSFTFKSHVMKKGYKNATLTVALLLMLIPALIMTGIEYFDQPGEGAKEPSMDTEYVDGTDEQEDLESIEALGSLQNVYVVEVLKDEAASSLGLFEGKNLSVFTKEMAAAAPEMGEYLSHIRFTDYDSDLDKACKDSEGSSDTLILAVDYQAGEYILNVLIPEGSSLSEDTAYGLETVMNWYGTGINAAMSGDLLGMDSADPSEGEEPKDDMEMAKTVMGYLIPYLNIMILYFFVLFYGQGVTQSVIMEKTSKLMDAFLISVRPAALILGKVTAICLAGVIQLSIWIFGLGVGLFLGKLGAETINPNTDQLLVQLLSQFGGLSAGMFSVGGIIIALLIMLAGMLLYCSMAGIGGALAGKPEDLSSTNILFTLVLIASFFANLLAGGLEGMGGGAAWLDWVPFTAIMITPARVLLGSVSLIKGLACLVIVVATAVIFAVLAGKLYRLMALYKGDVPSPKQMVAMIRQSRGEV